MDGKVVQDAVIAPNDNWSAVLFSAIDNRRQL